MNWFGWLGMGHESGQDVMIGVTALWIAFAQIRRMVGRDD
jgi:hypothetical protein